MCPGRKRIVSCIDNGSHAPPVRNGKASGRTPITPDADDEDDDDDDDEEEEEEEEEDVDDDGSAQPLAPTSRISGPLVTITGFRVCDDCVTEEEDDDVDKIAGRGGKTVLRPSERLRCLVTADTSA